MSRNMAKDVCITERSDGETQLVAGENKSVVPKLWSQLWKLKIQYRHRVLLWRIATETITLTARGDLCPSCNIHPESVQHLFLNCDIARGFWLLEGMGLQWNAADNLSGLDIVKKLLRDNEQWNRDGGQRNELIIRSTAIFEEILSWRNSGSGGNKDHSITRIKARVREQLQIKDKYARRQLESEDFQMTPRLFKQWWRIEVDAAYTSCGQATVGVIACDKEGLFRWAWSSPISAYSAMEAEASAVLNGVLTAKFMNIKEISIIGDNVDVVANLAAKTKCSCLRCKAVFSQIRSQIPFFSAIEFVWQPRRFNTAAHELCQWAVTSSSSGFCNFGELPTVVRNALKTRSSSEAPF